MPSKIVIAISANIEWQALKTLLPQDIDHLSPYGEWFEPDGFSLNPESGNSLPLPLIFFHQGWGKIAAAAATQYAIDRWQPELLVNLGTCGGFAGEIEKYAIVLAEKTVVYDIIEQMGDFDEHIAHYTTEIDLSWLKTPYPHDVVRTLLVSGDRDLLVDQIPQLKEKFGAVAGDWESGAIAWVAARNGVRCLILRGVTDLVDGETGEAYGNLDVFMDGTQIVFRKLIAALPAWLALIS